ncbi:tubulin polyglutamylase complex subunit 2 isoform X2 [Myxocyprinus asiaticus]|uniref:tubulin polyglutamylase complex subunit 2 isoform X2 n=1 Tax=Myxocyprinus asiaticus TaxID=70543 RepID=UPI00222185FB|nr:tubulin polyglutamylase complex subunit 2 isoform X2 [Myxocyprinus asiaticus]
MEDARDDKTITGFVDRLTFGITRVLESLPGVLDVRFAEKAPAEKRCLMSWEQKNNCALPEDLRDFYLTTDGFMLTWNSKLGNEAVPVGRMVINSIAQLRPLLQSSVYSLPNAPTLADLDFDDDLEESDGPEQPHFDSRSRIFELDPCNGNGKVCLVYKSCTPGVIAQQCEVWFLDRSLFWHCLTPSFTAYYRLMITYLGLPEWQYNFTPYGPSPQAKQWAALYQPLTFHGDPNHDTASEPLLNKLDPAKAFRGKAKPPTPKKKQPAQAPASGGSTAKGQGVSGRHSMIKR